MEQVGAMRVLTYFALLVVTITTLVALLQITFVTDLITASGYSTGEVFSGLAGIAVIFYTAIFALTFKS